VRDGEALQRLTEVRTFVIDKTGTLTEGKMKVVKFEGEVKLASLPGEAELPPDS